MFLILEVLLWEFLGYLGENIKVGEIFRFEVERRYLVVGIYLSVIWLWVVSDVVGLDDIIYDKIVEWEEKV